MNPHLADLGEVNLVDHPFKRAVLAEHGGEYERFDYRYFDDPTTRTGFRGYGPGGNGADGARDYAAEAHEIASIPGVQTVLDVGCAKGYLVRALRELGLSAHGIDISRYAVESADRDTRRFLRVLPLQDLDPEERYDAVHVCGVLIYLGLTELRDALSRFHRIARRAAVFDEPSREHLTRLLDAGDWGAVDPLRTQELPQETWERLYEEAGFGRLGRWHLRVDRDAVAASRAGAA